MVRRHGFQRWLSSSISLVTVAWNETMRVIGNTLSFPSSFLFIQAHITDYCYYISDPEWASYNIGIFVCTRCAGVHRSMGAHISKVKHLKLDRWEDSQVNRIREVGNALARLHYEERVPSCYRKPSPDSPQWVIEHSCGFPGLVIALRSHLWCSYQLAF